MSLPPLWIIWCYNRPSDPGILIGYTDNPEEAKAWRTRKHKHIQYKYGDVVYPRWEANLLHRAPNPNNELVTEKDKQ